MPKQIERVILNFTKKCNLGCKFCYVPFSGVAYDAKLVFAILDRCRELGARIITFAGGDPYLFSEIDSALEEADKLGLVIHVDTNGLALKSSSYSKLVAHVDLIGFPLDGADPGMQAKMRGSARCFEVVVNHLRCLRHEALRLKINTVVTAQNAAAIPQLASFLCQFRLDVWSIYQFWKVSGVTQNNASFAFTDAEFQRVVDSVTAARVPFRVEPGPVKERKGTYFFVTHYGQVYSSDADLSSRYNFLGSIFEDRTIDRWKALQNTSIRERIKKRYIYTT